jgi:hypothetical protein
MECLPEGVWRLRQVVHEERVDAWVDPHLARRSAGISHPVEDFLFTYYSYRPAALRRWHPGIGTRLGGQGAGAFGLARGYVVRDGGAEVDTRLPARRTAHIQWIRRLLVATADRPMALSCFGLHEWAMVYRQPTDEVRHASYPLRLGAAGTDTVVERHRVACTHFDAFRFFTVDARPRNRLTPTRETQHEFDQPGCLPATMDCYKWAYKLSPFAASELVADCFALARDVRIVDMQASPYDLTSIGIEPIRIEAPEGKAEYVAAQRAFADRAARLREQLVQVCDRLLIG